MVELYRSRHSLRAALIPAARRWRGCGRAVACTHGAVPPGGAAVTGLSDERGTQSIRPDAGAQLHVMMRDSRIGEPNSRFGVEATA
jgi:hypothetical protein